MTTITSEYTDIENARITPAHVVVARKDNVWCGSVLVIIALAIWFGFPITEIVMAEKYRDDMSCSSFIAPYTWMVVTGCVGVLAGCVYLSTLIFALRKVGGIIIYANIIIFYFCGLFGTVWSILGGIMFWRDCPHLRPTPMNTLFWIVLIVSYVGILGQILNKSKKDK